MASFSFAFLDHPLTLSLSPLLALVVLARIASALELKKGAREYESLMDLAAAAKGRVPQDLLSDEEVAARLPILFRTLRSKPLSGEQLEKLIGMCIEQAWAKQSAQAQAAPAPESCSGAADRHAEETATDGARSLTEQVDRS